MALDFLSAPAASMDVERLFSHSGLVVAKHCYNLTPDHIRQSTVLSNWLSIDGLVPVKAISLCLDKRSGKEKQDAEFLKWTDTDLDDEEEEQEEEAEEEGEGSD
ncbi:hypothetical protein BT96DRAFT_936160 [Gymnopus androsaceus JB14]|uniref:HAT C-terminal dimerisation domain-containing protein n=1 Tax=Gymnopus androsaceus JB14 TaxID=1447944 RepID=A0A6A4HYV3_9AGAR|nr:hypothetical protein BT96DRAFT_936160 [Gymnopus androsaceus JB14]